MECKKVAIIQSNYMPWVGYFGIIRDNDVFIFLDDVQYTRRDWRNRNKIKTPQGPKWLTIPVSTKGNYASQRITEVPISDPAWAERHINLIRQNYPKAPFFSEVMPFLENLYTIATSKTLLSEVNHFFIREICRFLDIETTLTQSTDYFSLDVLDAFSPTERLLELCKKEAATTYISGPSAKKYMDTSLFKESGIDVVWTDYSRYKPYPQLYGNFMHGVSIIDTMMMLGKQTGGYLLE